MRRHATPRSAGGTGLVLIAAIALSGCGPVVAKAPASATLGASSPQVSQPASDRTTAQSSLPSSTSTADDEPSSQSTSEPSASSDSDGVTTLDVAETTPRMSAPLTMAYQSGTYAAGTEVKLYCHRNGMPRTDDQGQQDSYWYNTSDGYWISDAALARSSDEPYAPECGTDKTSLASADDLKTFVKDRTGRSLVTWENVSPGQCVSVVDQFFNNLYGVVLTGDRDAWMFAPGLPAGRQIKAAGFSWHTDQKFEDGDVIVMNRDARMKYGHVALYYEGKLFESNVNGRMTAELDPVHLTNYLGYWRA